jgi:tetratricopeptide (TPR) repeat protein
MFFVARLLQDRSPEITARLCRFIVSCLSSRTSIAADRLRAAAAVAEGVALGSIGDLAGSSALNDYVIRTFERSEDVQVRIHVAWAMVNNGHDQLLQDRFDDAIAAYEHLVQFAPFEAPFTYPVAQGLMNWAMALDRSGRHLEEMAIYDRISHSLESAKVDDPEVHLLAWALINKAITLHERHEDNDAVQLFDAVLRRWWSVSDWNASPQVREAIAAALRHRANSMAAIGEYEVAIADVDRLLERYFGADESGVSQEVAWAILTKAASLEALKRPEEAKQAYDALVNRFRRSSDKGVKAAVASARRVREGLD